MKNKDEIINFATPLSGNQMFTATINRKNQTIVYNGEKFGLSYNPHEKRYGLIGNDKPIIFSRAFRNIHKKKIYCATNKLNTISYSHEDKYIAILMVLQDMWGEYGYMGIQSSTPMPLLTRSNASEAQLNEIITFDTPKYGTLTAKINRLYGYIDFNNQQLFLIDGDPGSSSIYDLLDVNQNELVITHICCPECEDNIHACECHDEYIEVTIAQSYLTHGASETYYHSDPFVSSLMCLVNSLGL